ncbi:MAG: hypothetical protein K5989_12845 [Lachnospiraceae bacterium]|nr:hypothetical protein [Lachnospiraceae bacterium]
MEKNILAVFDRDEEYVTKLMNYLLEAKPMPLNVQAFTDKLMLKKYMKENDVDILLIPEEELDDEIEAVGPEEMMVLSESDSAEDSKGHKTVCKYQSSENIMREVMCYYAEKPVAEVGLVNSQKTQLFAVYSPVRRCFRTSFAIALGQVLSERGRSLYVNLEDYSGFNQILQKNYMADLSDLIFYIGQKKRNFSYKLASMVQTLGNLDFIPPVISPVDLKAVDRDTWITFVNELQNCGYENIIFDFGDSIQGFLEILSVCTTIYTPVREDFVSSSKIEQYEAMLRILECGEVLRKTKKITIPYFRNFNGRPEKLISTPMGDYARTVLKV